VLGRTDLDVQQRDLLKTIIGSAATLDGILAICSTSAASRPAGSRSPRRPSISLR